MKIEILQDAAAFAALADPKFAEAWECLWDHCPWATGSQRFCFLQRWYAAYKPHFEPLIVTGRDDRLLGILPLAVHRVRGALAYAGTHHSEYQVWLSMPAVGDEFISLAMRALAGRYHSRYLPFLFLPPGTPLAWLQTAAFKGRHLIRPHIRPLRDLTKSSGLDASLRKKSNKSRISRLQRGGTLILQRLRTRAELERVFDLIISQCDLRQGALNQTFPFRDDPLKKSFYLSLMEDPKILHATVLKVGDEVVASHLGVCNRDSVSLGLITHSPFHARNSPGKLLLLMLAEELSREGYKYFDLTPGGEYKERFGDAQDVAHVLYVYFSGFTARRQRFQFRVRNAVKAVVQAGRIDPGDLRRGLRASFRRLANLRPKRLPEAAGRLIGGFLWCKREYRVYRYPAAKARDLPDDLVFHRDSVRDLLDYEAPAGDGAEEREFFRTGLNRLEEGAHVYTLCEGGKLLHAGWLWERRSNFRPDGYRVQLPPNSAWLDDGYTNPRASGRRLDVLSISKRMRDASFVDGTEWLFIGVRADNHPLREGLEKIGLQHYASLFTSVRLGFKRRWTVAVPRPANGPG